MLNKLGYPYSILKYQFKKIKDKKKVEIKLTKKENTILNEIKKKGYCVITNYYDKSHCDKLIQSINEELKNISENIYKDEKSSDERIFFSEKKIKSLKSYFEDDFIKKIGDKYLKNKLQAAFTLSNRVVYKDQNLGSGGGWHKDAYFNQFKSILYLNDVDNKNGPFQLIEKSHKLLVTLINSLILKKGYPDTRFSEEQIKHLYNKKIQTITGRAGTLILFDGSLVHRGAPLINGIRYAITNYYYPVDDCESQIKNFKDKIKQNKN